MTQNAITIDLTDSSTEPDANIYFWDGKFVVKDMYMRPLVQHASLVHGLPDDPISVENNHFESEAFYETQLKKKYVPKRAHQVLTLRFWAVVLSGFGIACNRFNWQEASIVLGLVGACLAITAQYHQSSKHGIRRMLK